MHTEAEPITDHTAPITEHAALRRIATHLLDAGADLSFVRDWLGHSNIQNTMVYAQLTTSTRDKTARTIFTGPSWLFLKR